MFRSGVGRLMLYLILYITIILSYTILFSSIPLPSTPIPLLFSSIPDPNYLLSLSSSSPLLFYHSQYSIFSLPFYPIPISSSIPIPSQSYDPDHLLSLQTHPIPNIHSILVGTYIRLFILFQSFQTSYLSILKGIYLSLNIKREYSSISGLKEYTYLSIISFYTCRYLHILIYIHLLFRISPYLTPHVLSEWMVEV